MLNIFQTSSNNSTALRMQNRGVVSIFGAGYPGCDLAAWVPNAPKMEGESKGGDLPSWHTTFGESLVCYTFCPGWRGKGAARSGAVTFTHQKIRRRDGAAAIIPLPDFGRGKRYIQPPSRRSGINAAACSAGCPAQPAPFSSPVSLSDGNALPFPRQDARLRQRSHNGRAGMSVLWR